MKSLTALFFKITVLTAMTILLVSCGGGGGGGSSSGSSGQSVTVKLNISQDNFRSAPTSRVSINGSEIASLLLTVTGNETNISEDILSAVENDGFVTLELILNNRYTFGIEASDADDNELCSGSTAVTINSAQRDVTLICESPDDNNNGGGGDGGDGVISFTINGVAASGLPLSGGMVYLKDANGTVVTAPIGEDGSYTISTTGLTAPFILKAVGTVGTAVKTLYAFTDNGGVMNINPYVNLAAAAALGVSDMDAVYEAPSGYRSNMTYENIAAASESIVRIFADIFAALGVSGSDPLSGSYSADSSGIDGILDYLDIKLTPSGFTVADKSTGNPVISGTVSDLTAETPPSIPADVEALIASYVSITVSQLAEAKAFMEDFYLSFSRGSYEAYLADDFTYNDGYTRDTMTTWTMYTGNYDSIENFQIFQRMTTDKLMVYFYVVDTNGGMSPVFYTIEKIAGTWYITGNEETFTATAGLSVTRSFGSDGTVTYNTGLMLSAAELTGLVDVAVINVTGPGLPEDGLNIIRDYDTNEPVIYNGTNSGNKYYMTASQLAQIQEAFDTDGYAAYTFSAYETVSQDYTPMGTAIQSITKTVYTSEIPLTNSAEDIDEYFIYASGLEDMVLSADTPQQSVEIAYDPQDKTVLSGNASYICESLTGETLSSATAFSGSSTHLYVNMTPADYSIMKNCVFDLTYNNETLTFISDEYLVASELNQYGDIAEFANAVTNSINETAILADNASSYVTSDLYLPSSLYGLAVTWAIEDINGVTSTEISPSGEIVRNFPAYDDGYAVITGTMQIGSEELMFGPFTIYIAKQDGIEVNANVGLGGLGYSNPGGEYLVYKYSYDSDAEEYNTLLKAMYPDQLLGDLNEANYEESGNFKFYGNYTEDADTDALYLVAIYGGFVPDEQFDGLETVVGTVPNETVEYALIPGDILAEGGTVNITMLTHTAFEFVRYMMYAKMSTEEIRNTLDEYAKATVKSDLNNDSVIDYYDVLAYHPYNGSSLNTAHISELNIAESDMRDIYTGIFSNEFSPDSLYDYINNTAVTLRTSLLAPYQMAARDNIVAVRYSDTYYSVYNLNDPENDNDIGVDSGMSYGMGPMFISDNYIIITDDGYGSSETRAHPISGATVDTNTTIVYEHYTPVKAIAEANGYYYFEQGNQVEVTADLETMDHSITTGSISDATGINVSSDGKLVFRSNSSTIEVLNADNAYAMVVVKNFNTDFGFSGISSVKLYEQDGTDYIFFVANGKAYYSEFIDTGFGTPVKLDTGIADSTSQIYIDGVELYLVTGQLAQIFIYDISNMSEGAELTRQVDPALPYETNQNSTWAMAAYNGKVIMDTDDKTVVVDTNASGDLHIGKHYDSSRYIQAADASGNFVHTAGGSNELVIYYKTDDKLHEIFTVDAGNSATIFSVDLYDSFGVTGSAGAYTMYHADQLIESNISWNGDEAVFNGDVMALIDTTNPVESVLVDKEAGKAYISKTDGYLKIFDIATTSMTGDTDMQIFSEDMAVFNSTYLYNVTDGRLEGYDLSNGYTTLDTSAIAYDSADLVSIMTGHLILADMSGYVLHAYDIDPASGALYPYSEGSLRDELRCLTTDEETGIIYAAGINGGIYVYQIGTDHIEDAAYINTTSRVTDIEIVGDDLYISLGIGGLEILPKMKNDVYIPTADDMAMQLP